MARNLDEPGANFNQLLELSIKLQNARTFASKPKPNGVTTITSDDWLETIDPGGWATEDEEELNAGGRVGLAGGTDIVPKAKPQDYARTLKMLLSKEAWNTLGPRTWTDLTYDFAKKAREAGQISDKTYQGLLMPLFGETGEKITEAIERHDEFDEGGRVGFSRGTTLASAPWLRGTTGPNQILKAPRSKTGMADILKHEGAAIGALAINQLNKDKKDIVERIEKVEKDRKEPDQEPPKGSNDKLLESIKLANELRKLKKEKDRQIFDERMHGEAGGKGTFTGSGTERKSIAPPGFIPKDKSKLTLFRNNKNLKNLKTKTIDSLMEFRKNPELFYKRTKNLKDRGVDFDALYNPAEIAELLGLKTASGITDAIVSKNIPYEKIGAFKAVKLNDYVNSQLATIEKFKDVPLKGKEYTQRSDVMSEFRGLYSKFKDLRMDMMPKNIRSIYNKYNLSEVEGGHPNPLIFFSKKWKDGKLTNEREFDWIYRNKDKLLNKDNVVFQSKALNQKGGPFYDLISDLKEQYKILGPLVDKYEGKGRVTNLKDKKTIEAANKAITDIVAQSQYEVDDWLNKTGKYENRESKASDILSIDRMKEGGLHGNIFDTTTGKVALYTGAGEGAGTVSGAVDEDTLNVKLNTFSNYIDILTNVIEDKKDKQLLIEYFEDKVIPKFNRGGRVYGPYTSQIAQLKV